VAVIISLLALSTKRAVKPGVSLFQSLKEGIRFIRDREAMVALIVLAFLMTFLGVPLITFLPVVAKEVFHQGAQSFTILLCTSGAGAVCGALIVAWFGNVHNKGRVALLMLMTLGILIALFGLSTSFVLSCIFLFLAGAALIGVFSMISSLVQLIAPDEMRGRVMSIYNVAFRGGMPIGSLICGALIPKVGVQAVMAGNGVLLILLATYFTFAQRRVAQL
jgi:predicted MFS family arabinose efflux permease